MSKNKIIGIFIIFLIFLPASAFAWGLGVHLDLGMYLLDNISLLAPTIGESIINYRWYFLYGCLSPDVLIGKGKKISRTHSHNFETALKIINSNEPALKAYGAGYLSHLAADVVAHNYLVPNMLQLFKLNRGKIFHILIEGCIDRNIGTNQDIFKKIIKSNFKEADDLLLKIVQKKRAIFKIKKAIFKKGISINFLTTKNNVQEKYSVIQNKVLDSWDYIENMVEMSQKAIIDCLNKRTSSDLIKYDPMGFKNLKIAKTSNKISFKKRHRGVVPFFVPSTSLLNL